MSIAVVWDRIDREAKEAAKNGLSIDDMPKLPKLMRTRWQKMYMLEKQQIDWVKQLAAEGSKND